MISLAAGTHVVIDVPGKNQLLLGSIESVEQETIVLRLDDGQSALHLVARSRADLLVDADGGFMRLSTLIFDTQSNAKRIRLIKPEGITGRDRRANNRIVVNNAILWSELTDDGLLTEQRYGLTRDISVSVLAFETLRSPPKLGSIVAISGADPYQMSTVLATVVGTGACSFAAATSYRASKDERNWADLSRTSSGGANEVVRRSPFDGPIDVCLDTIVI